MNLPFFYLPITAAQPRGSLELESCCWVTSFPPVFLPLDCQSSLKVGLWVLPLAPPGSERGSALGIAVKSANFGLSQIWAKISIDYQLCDLGKILAFLFASLS